MRVIYQLTTLGLLLVIVVGAYTRIKDAGLGCPDWPGCYGFVIPPLEQQVDGIKFDTTDFDSAKAWIEMWHRYIAAILGLVVIVLASMEIIKKRNIKLSLSLIAVVLMQANLGRLTVTMKLQPIIVSSHLLGGLSLLFLLQVLKNRVCEKYHKHYPPKFFHLVTASYFLQVILGAWVSTNYAGLACFDFPYCSAERLFPSALTTNTFNFTGLWLSLEPLSFFSNSDKQFIHMIHRLNALVLGASILMMGYKSWFSLTNRQKVSFIHLTGIYTFQLAVGILLIYLRLPVYLATAHNFLAAIMGLVLIRLYYISPSSVLSLHKNRSQRVKSY